MLCAAGSVILTFAGVSAAALDSTGPACTDAKCKNQILRRSMPLEVVCIGMTSASVVSFTMTVVCAQKIGNRGMRQCTTVDAAAAAAADDDDDSSSSLRRFCG